ncbi:MAG: hypothetical protein HY355_01360 [Armatimonadetes bacterium]|nr:hypothetical protein [Armatimonadota bacterium]
MARPPVDPLLKRLRETVIAALEERRGLVVYSRIQAQEMDQMARRIEREAIEQVRAALHEAIGPPELGGVRNRIHRMDEQIQELDEKDELPERSRLLERDDIIWRAFEDIAYLLGIE